MTFFLDNVGKLTAVHAVDREIIQKLLKRPDSIKFTSCFANQHTSQTARTLLQSLLSVLFPYFSKIGNFSVFSDGPHVRTDLAIYKCYIKMLHFGQCLCGCVLSVSLQGGLVCTQGRKFFSYQ